MKYNAFMNRVSLCIFDMDGLLIDSERIYLESAMECSRVYGYGVGDELIRRTMGNNLEETKRRFFETMGDDFPYEQFRKDRLAIQDEYLKNHPIEKKKGAEELLNYLDEKKIRKAVATSTRRERANQFLESAGLTGRFDRIVYGDDLKQSKPRPEIYLKAISAFDVDRSEILAFEDSGNGILSAVGAGINVVLVPDLAYVADEVKEKSFTVLHDLTEAVKLIDEINR